jgi:DNA processing protein
VGVIGSGIDVVYPPENKSLYDDVANSGAIISEYPPGTPALRAHFPARNRIISGLALGVAVIEAPRRSGALITAARALEQGRDVFTLPGNVDAKSSEGSNTLLREGAIPVLSGEDIVNEYAGLFPDKINDDVQGQTQAQAQAQAGVHVSNDGKYRINSNHDIIMDQRNGQKGRYNDKKEIDNKTEVDYIDLDAILSALTGDEKTVAETIGASVMHVDDIITNSSLSIPQALTALTMLEINGYAEREGYGKWKIKQ